MMKMENDTIETGSAPNSEVNYANVLDEYGIAYEERDSYLYVGKINTYCGWIIHLSVIRSKLEELLRIVAPIFVKDDIPFKIPNNGDTARLIMDGDWGLHLIGKIVSIYPYTTTLAINLVTKLNEITKSFIGPMILTDAYLGGCIYTRYGAHNKLVKVSANGTKRTFYIDESKNEVEDILTIPFTMPVNIKWPFGEYKIHSIPKLKKNNKVKIFRQIKSDAKGNVYEGLYLHNGWLPKHSIIKQGIKYMISNWQGQDIYNRLELQFRLQSFLKNKVNVPKPYKIIKNEDAWYLVMQKIQGESLTNTVKSINLDMKSFFELSVFHKDKLIYYAIQLTEAIEKLHNQAIVHRDATPSNFIVDYQNRLFLIDIELAYSLKHKIPAIPFELGTKGYMSPEQMMVKEPTEKEDIYALGAALIEILLGITPITIQGIDTKKLISTITHLSGSTTLANIIVESMDIQPNKRPTTTKIKNVLSELRLKPANLFDLDSQSKKCYYELDEFINKAIKCLIEDPLPLLDGYWTAHLISKNKHEIDKNEHTIDYRLFNGICGVLFLINTATKQGYNVGNLKSAYKHNFTLVANEFLNENFISSGLHFGTSGLGLAVYTGIEAKLLQNIESNKALMLKCINLGNSDLTIGNGLAGIGLFLLNICRDFSDPLIEDSLSIIKDKIVREFKPLLSEIRTDYELPEEGEQLTLISGKLGLAYFLLEYWRIKESGIALKDLESYINGIEKKNSSLRKRIEKKGLRPFVEDGGVNAESLLCLLLFHLKCYEVFRAKSYILKFDNLANLFPEFFVSNNFSLNAGIIGLGEIYLKAYNLTGEVKWKIRALWIVNSILLFSKENSIGGQYWTGNNRVQSTTGLMSGNSGIIHFLINFQKDGKIGYPVIG